MVDKNGYTVKILNIISHPLSTTVPDYHPPTNAHCLNMLKNNASCYLLPLFFFCLLPPVVVSGSQLETYASDAEAVFSLPDLRGRERSLADYRGKVVLVNFWASWCPPCIYEMPELVRLKQRLAHRPFEILALNVGEKKYRVRKFVKLINFDLPVLLDTSKDTFNAWGVETLPTTFLVDADGRIRYRVLGNPDWEDPNTIAIVEKLLSENAQTPADKSTVTDNETNR